jgi:hypothetical protein
MSINPDSIMICIDMQGEEHHCREEQEFFRIPDKTKITTQ